MQQAGWGICNGLACQHAHIILLHPFHSKQHRFSTIQRNIDTHLPVKSCSCSQLAHAALAQYTRNVAATLPPVPPSEVPPCIRRCRRATSAAKVAALASASVAVAATAPSSERCLSTLASSALKVPIVASADCRHAGQLDRACLLPQACMDGCGALSLA